MMSDVRYEIKNFITCYLTWNIDTNLGWFVRNEHEHDQLILVDLVEEDVEDSSTDWSSKLLTMRSKEKKECYSLILIYIVIDHHFTFGSGNRIYQILLMWSQINLRSSIRLTGGRQIDFLVFKP